MLCFAVFASISFWRAQQPLQAEQPQVPDRVVISAPILLLLYGGDRFLAADLETMRLAATSMYEGQSDTNYLIRAQQVVAQLNGCHEDNYYLANGLLTWGGADREGSEVLRLAGACRFWDEYPLFFYGFNKFFFERDVEAAAVSLEEAASRATANAAGFRKFAIMLKTEQIQDERLALEYLQAERDKSSDPKLKDMLAKRVQRLQGLVTLREAQRRFEVRVGSPLAAPEQLFESGLLTAFPEDPLKLGYEFVDGRFVLKKLKVAGVEDR